MNFVKHSVDEITNDLQIYTRRNWYHFDLNLLEKFHLQTELNIWIFPNKWNK